MTNKDFLFPLRRLHGYIHQRAYNYRERQRFYRSVLSSSSKKVVLMGTPTHPNIGDSAIVLAEYAFLEKCGFANSDVIEITFEDLRKLNYSVKKILKKCAIICWHGGGNMGTIWPHEEKLRRCGMRRLPTEFPSLVFPQTIYYEDTPKGQLEKKNSIPIYNGRSGLTIVAREQLSYEIMCRLYPKTQVVVSPDIVLSCEANTFGVEKQDRNGILLCLRCDKERFIDNELRSEIEDCVTAMGVPWRYTDMYAEEQITKENRAEIVRKKMTEIASSKLIITDRLHGMVFAALTETPCLVLGNNNHKVKGTYEWIKHLPYIRFAESTEELLRIPKMLELLDNQYNSLPLVPYFDRVKDMLIAKMKLQ